MYPRIKTHLHLLVPAVFISLLLARMGTVQAADSPRRNVLFIVTDDMNNDLDCYGHAEIHSPAIDRLAQKGMRFDNAHCQVTVCNPSRVSMLSGLRPDKTQVYTLVEKTRSHLGDWVMLPEYFKHHGYFTAGIGKIYHTDEGYEDPRSWDVEVPEYGKRPNMSEVVKWGDPDGPGDHTSDWAWLKTPDAETPDGTVARKAVAMMEQAVEKGEPFFVGAGFRRPHAPYAAPEKYFELYPVQSMELPQPTPAGYYDSMLEAAINYPPPEEPMTDLEQRELTAAYRACISFVDAQVGVLLEAVDRLGLWDNTVILFVSDHGYHTGDHGGLWHKMSLFEESTRVPLIVYAPGMQASGQATEQLVELIDFYPTLVSLTGLPDRKGLDGIDFSPVLDDPRHETKEAVFSVVSRSNDPNGNHAKSKDYLGRSVRTARYRYTEWDHGKRGVELYDHQTDPRELVNLADKPELASVQEHLRELLLSSESQ